MSSGARLRRPRGGRGPPQDFYQAMIDRAMRPELAHVTLTRKLAALTLRLRKTGERYDPTKLRAESQTEPWFADRDPYACTRPHGSRANGKQNDEEDD
jgi:hypothetical protein